MTPIEPKELQDFLSGLFHQLPPKTEIKVDEPDTEDGVWFIDVWGICVKYQHKTGFEIFFPTNDGYGTKPDVVAAGYMYANDVIRQNIFMGFLGPNPGDSK